MITTIYNKQKDLPIRATRLKKMVPFLLEQLDIKTDEVIIHFVSKKTMGKIHEEFFSDPSPTDCMSFPIDPPEKNSPSSHHILGEIFVCPQVAVEYSLSKDQDPFDETTLYIIHGLLHLLGYDDIDPKDRKKMRQMEKACKALIAPFSLDPQKKDCLKFPVHALIKPKKAEHFTP
jgi:probable rRNA maturation factor